MTASGTRQPGIFRLVLTNLVAAKAKAVHQGAVLKLVHRGVRVLFGTPQAVIHPLRRAAALVRAWAYAEVPTLRLAVRAGAVTILRVRVAVRVVREATVTIIMTIPLSRGRVTLAERKAVVPAVTKCVTAAVTATAGAVGAHTAVGARGAGADGVLAASAHLPTVAPVVRGAAAKRRLAEPVTRVSKRAPAAATVTRGAAGVVGARAPGRQRLRAAVRQHNLAQAVTRVRRRVLVTAEPGAVGPELARQWLSAVMEQHKAASLVATVIWVNRLRKNA